MTPKFRAWHKLHGEMREVYGITFNNEQKITSLLINGFQPGERSEFFWYQAMDETDKYDMSMKFEDLFVLLQYTGCRDKNGVDIYEGDYLSLIIFEANTEFKGEVVFSEGSFCVAIQIKGHDYKVPLHETTEGDSLVEVLGNIYENPKLLED